MKKSLFIAALATLALASCSKNEVIELQQDQIKFSAVADNASRGTVVKTNDLNTAGTEIGVWGFLKSDDVNMDNELYVGASRTAAKATYSSTTNSFELNDIFYWPVYTMNFYAVYPSTFGNIDWTAFNYVDNFSEQDYTNIIGEGSAGKLNFIVNDDVSLQEDLLYAVKTDASKETHKNSVPLNFRHALSQIVFNLAMKDGARLEVYVKDISICNLDNAGIFQFPNTSTDLEEYNYSDDPDENNPTEVDSKGWGQWNLGYGPAESPTSGPLNGRIAKTNASYNVTTENGNTVVVRGSNQGEVTFDPSGYTLPKNLSSEFSEWNPMLLLPQTITVTDDNSDNLPSTWTCAYLKINCQVNSFTMTGGFTEPVRIYPALGNEYGELYVPLSIDWKQGVKYVYTLKFGYDGDSPVGPDGEDVFEKIKFGITVDEFQYPISSSAIDVPLP